MRRNADSRRNESVTRFRATVVSQAPGRDGMPSRAHACSAEV